MSESIMSAKFMSQNDSLTNNILDCDDDDDTEGAEEPPALLVPRGADLIGPTSAFRRLKSVQQDVPVPPPTSADDLPYSGTIMHYTDVMLQTVAETFLYHCWYFWAPPLYSYVIA